jgi:hypothetical protein
MAGVGEAASIIGILQLTATVVKYLNDVKGASKDCTRILVEISSLYRLLSNLQELVDAAESKESWSPTVRSLGVPNGPLVQYESTLESLKTYLKPVFGWRKAGRALIWRFEKSKIINILQRIERQKAQFILTI